MIASALARDNATLIRCVLKRKSSPRGVSLMFEEVIETMATGASCPWKRSIVPTLPFGIRREISLT